MKQCCQNKNKIQVKKMIINFKDNHQEKEKLYKIVQYKNIIKFRKNNLLILLIISLLNYSSFLCKFKSKFSEVTIKIKEVKDEHPENILAIILTFIEFKEDKSISDIPLQFKNIDSVDVKSLSHLILTVLILSVLSK